MPRIFAGSEEVTSFSLLGIVIWSIAALFFLYEFFLRSFVGTIGQQITADLHLSAEGFALLSAAYFLAYGIMQLPVGIICEKFGVKRVMLFAIIICVIATLLFGQATLFWSSFLSRFLMGFGSAFAFVALLVITIQWLPGKYFGFYIGLAQFIGTLGPLLGAGPFMSMLNSLHESWRLATSQIAIAGAFLGLLTLLFVHDRRRKKRVRIIVRESSSGTLALLRSLFSSKQALSGAFYAAFVYSSIVLFGNVWGTEFLQSKGLSQTASAYCVSALWIGYAIGCPILGLLSDLYRRRRPFMILPAVLGFFATILILVSGINSLFAISILFIALGFAAAGQSVSLAFVAEVVPEKVRASSLAFNNGLITVFATLLPPFTGMIIDLFSTTNDTSAPSFHSFFLAFLIMPILLLLAVFLSQFGLKETFCRPQKEIRILNLYK